MKSGNAERLFSGRFWGTCGLLAKVVFLAAGYYLLSPENCRLAAGAASRLAAWMGECAGWGGWAAGDWPEMAARLFPPMVLAGAAVCVAGLFLDLRGEGFWLALAMAGGAAWGHWGMRAPWWAWWRCVDALYAGVCLILLAGWMAGALYKRMRHGGQAVVLLGLVAAGCMIYEALAHRGVFEFRAERWVRPTQVLDQVFGVLDKAKDDTAMHRLPGWLAEAYYLFHALLAFFGAFVIVGAVSKPLVNAMLFRLSQRPDCMFWGVSPEALALAKDLSRKRRGRWGWRMTCVFAVNEVTPQVEAALARTDFLWVVEGREKPSVAARRAARHFFLNEDGSANVASAERLAKVARGGPEAWVRIDEEADDAWLHRWADRSDIRKALEVHIVRETSLAADILLRDHPMLKAPGVKCNAGTVEQRGGEAAAFRLLLVGFGWQGRMILNRTICDVQVPGSTFEADVADKDASAMELYAVRNPDAVRVYQVRFHTLDAMRRKFHEWLERKLAGTAYTRIVVATGDDTLNLAVGDSIDRWYREKGNEDWARESRERLFVRVLHPEQFAGFAREKDGTGKPLPFTPFGSLEEIYAGKNLLDSDLDRIARKLNARWRLKREPTERQSREEWRKASFFNRESSRASAMGLENLWRLSGLAGDGKTGEGEGKKGEEGAGRKGQAAKEAKALQREAWEAALAGDRAMAARLAEAEHLRWMAFHYVRGVRAWNPKTEPGLWRTAGGEVKANLREGANRHAALVPFAALPHLAWQLETMFWRDRAAQLKTNAATAEERELGQCFQRYADEVEAKMPSPNGLEPGKEPGNYGTDYPLWFRNKCAWMWEKWEGAWREFLWDNGFPGAGGKPCGKLAGVEAAIRQAVFGAMAPYVASAWPEPPRLTPGHLPGTAMDWSRMVERTRQDIGAWGRWTSAKTRKALRFLEQFGDSADAVFGKTVGDQVEPDPRFRTPGDMVGNDFRVVQLVPDCLRDDDVVPTRGKGGKNG